VSDAADEDATRKLLSWSSSLTPEKKQACYSDGYLDDAEAECSQHGGRVRVKADAAKYHRSVVEHGSLTCQLTVSFVAV